MNLHQALVENFDIEELRSLCFELGIDFDDLRGEGKTGKARELIALVVRQKELNKLVDKLKERRPNTDWDNYPLPLKPFQELISRTDKRLLAVGVGIIILLLIGVIWLLRKQNQTGWIPGEAVEEELFGIAVAEFTIGGDQERDVQGREMSLLLYQELERLLLTEPGLAGRVVLTKVGVVKDAEEARKAGEDVQADLVLWGWIPESSPDAIVPHFTLLDEGLIRNDSYLVQSINLMISGPGTIRITQLSGRTAALSRFVFGIVYLRGESPNDYERALEMFSLGIVELDQDIERINSLIPSANTLEQKIALEESQAALRKALAVFYVGKGIAYAALDDSENAFTSYEKALELDDSYSRAYNALGNHYYSQREFDKAIAAFEKSIELEPTLPNAYYGLGVAYYYQGQYRLAITSLNEAIRLTPEGDEPVLAYLAKGYAHKDLGELVAAQAAFEVVINSQAATDDIKQAALQEITSISVTITHTTTPQPTPLPFMTSTLLATPILRATPSPTLTFIPSITLTSGNTPQIRIIVPTANVRSGPGVDYAVVAFLNEGNVILVIGKTRDGFWFYVQLLDGQGGWLAADVSEPVYPLLITQVPVITIQSTMAAASSTPLPIPTYTLLPTVIPPLPTATPLLPIPTPSVTLLPTPTPSVTLLPTPTPSVTLLPTPTPSVTLLPTGTLLPTSTPAPTASGTPIPSATPTLSTPDTPPPPP